MLDLAPDGPSPLRAYTPISYDAGCFVLSPRMTKEKEGISDIDAIVFRYDGATSV